MSIIVFFDLEISQEKNTILDIGAIRSDHADFHKNQINDFRNFISHADFFCGHNIVAHDLLYLQKAFGEESFGVDKAIDTLFLSPLLYPRNPYHSLLKDDKLQTDELNNPLNDAKKSRDLFYDEVNAFEALSKDFKVILNSLLHQSIGFSGFFKFVEYHNILNTEFLEIRIRELFFNKICQFSKLDRFIKQNPVALSYALALLNCDDRYSITPPWVLKNYPNVERIIFSLRNTPCITGCNYCNKALDPIAALKRHFGFDGFRSYGDEPLQFNAVKAAIQGNSLLAIFPTGGGKSITFQVPALMSGENAKALTVVISPLQSLMKDQVDNLEKKGITEAVTINGLLDPIERSQAIERIENGHGSLLYISPESLRSVTIERLLLKRKIARFVIDEAHCFSSWGQDFRVDYLYIGDFIKNLQLKKNLEESIPVSCFTATAKRKVIEDICNYFKTKLNLNLQVIKANASRTNLNYRVYQKDNEEDKYNQLRSIIELKECPVIVYVSRTKRAFKLAERLSNDGLNAKPYHGKMAKEEKTLNQNAFMTGEVKVMVATSAFGMGVDKDDVGAVIHYDISDSLENYVQEAGRAGRNENITADCYVLFNEEDLDRHFVLLNQSKISSKEINQIWKAIKDLTKTRDKVSNSALEIARIAGWDDGINEIETRVKTAIAALEDAGYLKRGHNMPRVYANSILSKTAQGAISKIQESEKFDSNQKIEAIRIIKKLFSSKSKRLSTEEIAESRIDYISDQLGIWKDKVIRIIELLREEGILADSKDLTAFIKRADNNNRVNSVVDNFRRQEDFLLSCLGEEEDTYNLKELNEKSIEAGIYDCTPYKIKTIINFWTVNNWIKRQSLENSRNHIRIGMAISKSDFEGKVRKRHFLAKLVADYLHRKSNEYKNDTKASDDILIEFSVHELKEMTEKEQGMFVVKVSVDDIEDTLFYLSRIDAIKIEGGFLVVHNKLSIDRLEKNNRIQYKESDYENLRQYYQQKVQKIHIVGEYAKKMIRNYNEALQFVDDYFNLNYPSFLSRYFPGSRQDEIKRTLTPEKFRKLFGTLSPAQLEIIKDGQSPHIIVAAGPGSGKTRVLVHKLASLLLAEDVKHEQLLMLTFARASANEFKKRLLDLIGNAANFIEIKTFHSYCFDLLGRVGTLSQSSLILKAAIEKVRNREIEISRITKTVLVIDEAQDINADEYELIKVLMEQNEEMRIILVGDDDQNIYTFRGSDSRNMLAFIRENDAKKYELIENYRSKSNIVQFTNQWVELIRNRLKVVPIFSKQQGNGIINVTEYRASSLIVPIVESVCKTSLFGSTCILTRTNDEASQIAGLLIQNGIKAKLIQTNDGFGLDKLYELRYFSNLLGEDSKSPIISDEEWGLAIMQFSVFADRSSNKQLVKNIINQFELTNTSRKYKSDWSALLKESKIEDFAYVDSEIIYVSTIHKAKGKEFDNVYVMLTDFMPDGDELKRELYVAITRAKSNLSIHYNGKYLQFAKAENLSYNIDNSDYGQPQQVSLQLTHRDVQLGYFEFVQKRLIDLLSGDALTILEQGFGNSKGDLIVKYSRKFSDTLNEWRNKGFEVVRAKVNFIVYWAKPEGGNEFKIVLPEILLRRNA